MMFDDQTPSHQVFDLASAIAVDPVSRDARLAFCAVGAFRDQMVLLQLNTRLAHTPRERI